MVGRAPLGAVHVVQHVGDQRNVVVSGREPVVFLVFIFCDGVGQVEVVVLVHRVLILVAEAAVLICEGGVLTGQYWRQPDAQQQQHPPQLHLATWHPAAAAAYNWTSKKSRDYNLGFLELARNLPLGEYGCAAAAAAAGAHGRRLIPRHISGIAWHNQ